MSYNAQWNAPYGNAFNTGNRTEIVSSTPQSVPYIFKEKFKMEVKFDLAATIGMLVSSQNDNIDRAIEQTKLTLETAEKGLSTSYERLEEAKAEQNAKNIFVIEAYISYLENSIAAYKQILQGYRDLRAHNADVTEDMEKAMATF